MDKLGVFDDTTYAADFEVLGIEDANAKLALLSGVIGNLSEPVQKQVTLAILAGDPRRALDAIQADVNSAPDPEAALNLTTDQAAATARGFADSDQPAATTDLEANRKPADETADAFAKQKRTADPVKVDANTQAAIATMVLLYAISQTIKPIVKVDADISPALTQLTRLALMTTRTNVDAQLRDYPTASEIAARIGIVRVPVDTYIRNEARMTGVRD